MRGILFTLFLFYLLSLLFSCSIGKSDNYSHISQLEREVVDKADQFYADGNYAEGVSLLRKFLEKFPNSSYSDDAAYRLAYVCVVDDKKNEFYDYNEALKRFKEVLKKYPETNYISACKNWIKILNLCNFGGDKNRAAASASKIGNQYGYSAVNRENKALKKENEKLKKTLLELEKALQR